MAACLRARGAIALVGVDGKKKYLVEVLEDLASLLLD
jgi:hypothetical protein